jgi:hypothetical protein
MRDARMSGRVLGRRMTRECVFKRLFEEDEPGSSCTVGTEDCRSRGSVLKI